MRLGTLETKNEDGQEVTEITRLDCGLSTWGYICTLSPEASKLMTMQIDFCGATAPANNPDLIIQRLIAAYIYGHQYKNTKPVKQDPAEIIKLVPRKKSTRFYSGGYVGQTQTKKPGTPNHPPLKIRPDGTVEFPLSPDPQINQTQYLSPGELVPPRSRRT